MGLSGETNNEKEKMDVVKLLHSEYSQFKVSSTSSELRDSTSLYRVPGAAAWPGLAAAAGAKFKI